MRKVERINKSNGQPTQSHTIDPKSAMGFRFLVGAGEIICIQIIVICSRSWEKMRKEGHHVKIQEIVIVIPRLSIFADKMSVDSVCFEARLKD